MASRGRGAKAKGAGFELKMAKLFTGYWGQEFHRTPGSGAWSSTHAGQDSQVGDIVPPVDSGFPFSIECKNHGENDSWSLENAFSSNLEFPQWWEQCVEDARRAKLTPMLICHRNRSKNFIVMPYSAKLEKNLLDNGHHHMKTNISYKDNLLDELETYPVSICVLEDFMDTFTPAQVVKLAPKMFTGWDTYISKYFD